MQESGGWGVADCLTTEGEVEGDYTGVVWSAISLLDIALNMFNI